MYAIEEFKNIQKILIIGAGGTAKALAARFKQENLDVTVLNRSEGRLPYFTELGCKASTWDTFSMCMFDLVVNTTSAGLKDEELPAPQKLIESILNSTHYVADAIYGKLTPFLQMAKKKNIIYKDGADMLLGQGVLANELFVNARLKKEAIKTEMQKSFAL